MNKAIAVLSLALALCAANNDISIKTSADLYNFMINVNSGMYGEDDLNVKLENDIDMSGITDFSPIGENTTFYGTFDGQGHTISNLTVTGAVCISDFSAMLSMRQ